MNVRTHFHELVIANVCETVYGPDFAGKFVPKLGMRWIFKHCDSNPNVRTRAICFLGRTWVRKNNQVSPIRSKCGLLEICPYSVFLGGRFKLSILPSARIGQTSWMRSADHHPIGTTAFTQFVPRFFSLVKY